MPRASSSRIKKHDRLSLISPLHTCTHTSTERVSGAPGFRDADETVAGKSLEQPEERPRQRQDEQRREGRKCLLVFVWAGGKRRDTGKTKTIHQLYRAVCDGDAKKNISSFARLYNFPLLSIFSTQFRRSRQYDGSAMGHPTAAGRGGGGSGANGAFIDEQRSRQHVRARNGGRKGGRREGWGGWCQGEEVVELMASSTTNIVTDNV